MGSSDRGSFARWVAQVERWISRAVIAALALVVASQLALLNPDWRDRLSRIAALEGLTLEGPLRTVADEPSQAAGWARFVVLSRPSAPDIAVFVGGRRAGDLGRGELRVPVSPGEAIVIDGRASVEATLVRLVAVSPGLSGLSPGWEATVDRNRVAAGSAR